VVLTITILSSFIGSPLKKIIRFPGHGEQQILDIDRSGNSVKVRPKAIGYNFHPVEGSTRLTFNIRIVFIHFCPQFMLDKFNSNTVYVHIFLGKFRNFIVQHEYYPYRKLSLQADNLMELQAKIALSSF
jgi:hypothetical protein